MAGDAGEYVGEPGLRINVAHFRRDDQAVHGGTALPATIGAGEQLRLASKRNPTRASFGGIVGQADATVVEETREGCYVRPARLQSRLAGSSSRSIDFDIADRIEQITKKMHATNT